jgi:anti-sigma-K factor RskA
VLRLAGDDTLRLEPLATTVVPDRRALQLWTKADGWAGPVSLGLVKPGEAVEIKLGKLPKVVPNQLFEITLEPAAGSPIGRPTGPILYIGRAVRMM